MSLRLLGKKPPRISPDGGSKTGAAEAPITLDSDGDSNREVDSFEESDAWEREIGLDEVIERPQPGLRHAFGVTETDGLNLSAPALLDLLSDESVDGAIEPIHTGRGEVSASEGPKDKEKMAIKHFKS
ncbi:hypothetical protein RSAG8_00964, partial [Rhizoctonia solani AG-8 WAC10335]